MFGAAYNAAAGAGRPQTCVQQALSCVQQALSCVQQSSFVVTSGHVVDVGFVGHWTLDRVLGKSYTLWVMGYGLWVTVSGLRDTLYIIKYAFYNLEFDNCTAICTIEIGFNKRRFEVQQDGLALDQWGHTIGRPWTTTELAQAAGLSPESSYLARIARDGDLSGSYKVGGVWLIPYAEGVRFLQERR